MSAYLLPALVAGLAVVVLGLSIELGRVVRRMRTIRSEHERMADLVRSAQSVLFFTVDSSSPNRLVRYVSAGMAAALGRPIDDLVGEPVRLFVRRQDAAAIQRLLESSASLARPGTISTALVRADGRDMPVLLSIYPSLGAGTQERDTLVAAVDMTEHKRTEEEERRSTAQLTHSEKLKSLEILAGGVAHDFNNLLVGVLGNADLALMDLSPLSPARASIEAIKTSAVQASELTRQMLAYSGRGHFLVERIDLNAVIQNVSSLLKASVGGKVSLNYRLAAGLPPIEADVSQIRQLLLSLITNASDAIGDLNGIVTVRTHLMEASREYLATMYVDEDLPEGDYVCLEISDTGCGMNEQSLARVFDPFFSTKAYGRGFGLATVLSIVRGHKGAIRVDSAVGKGTTFAMLFPKVEPENAAVESRPDADGAEGQALLAGTVLVIDDEETVRMVAEGMLSRMGCRVITASGGAEGVEYFRQNRDDVDAVLLNMTMPGMNGQETLRALQAVRPDIRVVLCTGLGGATAVQTFGEGRLAGYIQKPFEARELNRLMQRVLMGAPDGGRVPHTEAVP